jgi:hypothetical protein
MSEELLEVSGACYCGAVHYRASAGSTEVIECHCLQCRKQSGHRFASMGVKTSSLEIDGDDNITWFSASSYAERGFCAVCGSLLFWKQSTEDYTAILAASVDTPSGLHVTKHIFVENKGDYYEITDGLPQFNEFDKPVTVS